jgi:TolB-like protein
MRRVPALIGLCVLGAWLPTNAAAKQREITAASAGIADEIAATTRRTVAVVDFTDLQGSVTELGRFIAEEMALGLVVAKKNLSVIDRTHLRTLMQEHKLGASGLIDPATARKLGQIAGVQALVTGTLTPFADSVRVVIKVLDTETALVLTAASMDIAKTKTIEELLARDISKKEMAASPSGASPTNPPRPVDSDARPSFQSGSLRMIAGQASYSSGNRSATLNIVVENVGTEPVGLAIDQTGGVALSDNKGTRFHIQYLTGVASLFFGSPSAREGSNYTLIGPSQRINLIALFSGESQSAERGLGSGLADRMSQPSESATWTFSAAAISFTDASGPRRISIGLTGIKPAMPR